MAGPFALPDTSAPVLARPQQHQMSFKGLNSCMLLGDLNLGLLEKT